MPTPSCSPSSRAAIVTGYAFRQLCWSTNILKLRQIGLSLHRAIIVSVLGGLLAIYHYCKACGICCIAILSLLRGGPLLSLYAPIFLRLLEFRAIFCNCWVAPPIVAALCWPILVGSSRFCWAFLDPTDILCSLMISCANIAFRGSVSAGPIAGMAYTAASGAYRIRSYFPEVLSMESISSKTDSVNQEFPSHLQ